MKSLKTYIKEEEIIFQTKLIDELCGSVGSGTKAAGVYESWVHIVTTLKGRETRPNRTQINKAREHGEFHSEGKKWLAKVEKIKHKDKAAEEKYWSMVCESIDYIGGDIKDAAMPTIPWDTADIIHKNIGPKYYKKMPKIWKTAKTKENTADIIIITKGTAENLSAALPNCTEKGSIKWDDKGKCEIPAVPGIEWYQISLKKGINDARIGKLTTWLKGKYVEVVTDVTKLGIQEPITNEVMQRGNYLGVSYGFDDRIDQILLDEGLFDVFKSIKDKVVGGFKKLVDWAKKKLRKLFGGIFKLANKVMSSNPVLDNANEILAIAGVSARVLSEEYLEEKENKVVEFKKDSDRKRLLKKMIEFEKQLRSHSVNAEYDKLVKKAGELDDQKRESYGDKPAVLFLSSTEAAKLEEKTIFAPMAADIIDKLKKYETNDDGKIVTAVRTGDLFLPLKVASHYTAYNAINVILGKIEASMKDYGTVMNAAMHFVADSKAEAKFGNTELPLWIVYGQRGKAHYMGRKQEFKEIEFENLKKNPHAIAVDQPFIVIRIVKAKVTASSYNLGGHNVTELYLMSGFQDKPPLPKYMLMNFTTSSGSSFTMKVEVEKEEAKSWIP
jgi:hypothetical protein